MVFGTVVMTENPTPLAAAARFNEVRLDGRKCLEYQFLRKQILAPVGAQDSDSHGNCKDSQAKLIRPLQTQHLGYMLLNEIDL